MADYHHHHHHRHRHRLRRRRRHQLLANHMTICHNIHALLHGLFNRLFLYS
jgi:hypothetical protein